MKALNKIATAFALVAMPVLFTPAAQSQTSDNQPIAMMVSNDNEGGETLSPKEQEAEFHALKYRTIAFTVKCAPSQIEDMKIIAMNALTYAKQQGLEKPTAIFEVSHDLEGLPPRMSVSYFNSDDNTHPSVETIQNMSLDHVDDFIPECVQGIKDMKQLFDELNELHKQRAVRLTQD
jgi:hypothetical protein